MIADNIENWRLIDGYDNYEVSSHGFVRNNQTNKILRTSKDKDGYQHVILYKDRQRETLRVHRLVASRFCENPNNYPVVDHISRDITNNHFSNLRWATVSMNCRNKIINGVSFVKSRNCWQARIVDDNRKRISKKFSINRYGNEEAKALATAWRREKAQEYGYLQ